MYWRSNSPGKLRHWTASHNVTVILKFSTELSRISKVTEKVLREHEWYFPREIICSETARSSKIVRSVTTTTKVMFQMYTIHMTCIYI